MRKHGQKIKELESEIQHLKSSVAELKVLNEIAVSSGKATDIDEMLNIIVKKSMKAVEAEQGSILIVNKGNDSLKTIIRQDDSSRLKHNYNLGTHITGWVLLNKQPLIIKNLAEDKRFKITEDEKKEIRSVLCVPIWFEGEILGLLMMLNKKNQQAFNENDLTLFSIISIQAGQLIKNLELQKETFLKIKEAEKLEELDRIKTNFFTNISHEFRTPLTLILGHARMILDKVNDNKIKEDIKTIFRNAEKLNDLINQLLDILKIEAGQMKLKTSPQNLVKVIKEIVTSFQAIAERKKISFNLKTTSDEIVLYLDKDKIEKILNNIISNAFKFTHEGGEISVELISEKTKEFVEIIISDTGIGIPKDQLKNIFNKFFQVENTLSEHAGSGIGLSLTKELVELHKGEISVVSEAGKGSFFKIKLPLGNKHLKSEEIIMEKSFTNSGKKIEDYDMKKDFTQTNLHENIADIESFINRSKPLLLVIEDNQDLRKFVREILAEFYQISEAANGKEGLLKSFDEIPDLIISDIMMPELDGNSLCKILKADSRTSHIPVILLTAKATLDNKLEGLETGADDYIMKPFEIDELKVRVKNLLAQRERLHEHFKKHGLFELEEKKVTPVDKRFLQNVLDIINKYISDPNFSVELFAEELAVSRSLLHKKLTALIGESPNELIRRVRLNKAAKLIEQKTGNISEIGYDVGFNNPSYFSECFHKQFGFSPSQYHQDITNKNKITL